MPDLFPTPTRLALLREVANGAVHHELSGDNVHAGRDCYCYGGPVVRRATTRMAELETAGWAVCPPSSSWRNWRITDAGRAVLAAHPERAS